MRTRNLNDLHRFAMMVEHVLDLFRCGFTVDDALAIVRSQHTHDTNTDWARVERAAYNRTV